MNERAGLALLVVGTLAAIWSAFNPSYFTIRKFGVTEEDRKWLLQGGVMAVALIIITLLGAWYVFGKGGEVEV